MTMAEQAKVTVQAGDFGGVSIIGIFALCLMGLLVWGVAVMGDEADAVKAAEARGDIGEVMSGGPRVLSESTGTVLVDIGEPMVRWASGDGWTGIYPLDQQRARAHAVAVAKGQCPGALAEIDIRENVVYAACTSAKQ